MTLQDYIQLGVFIFLLAVITPLLGHYMAKVFSGERTFLHGVLQPIERWIYRLGGIYPADSMAWQQYATSLIWFNGVGIVVLFILQIAQKFLPLNPQNLPGVSLDSAFNTAVSFVTNTDWQGYAGETTMSDFTQMIGLAVQNFLSAATGLAVAMALIRGITSRAERTLGNFWVDLTRATLYVLLPIAFVLALVFASQGTVQTFSAFMTAKTLEGSSQEIPLGPVASQTAIKVLGTNGGGFFNANSAHPFENPTPFSNFLQMLAILAIPASLTFTMGTMTKARRHGWTLFGTMLVLFAVILIGTLVAEYSFNPILHRSGLMEGKEQRFGIFGSVLYAIVTTVTSCGAVNAMHASLSPLAGGLALFNMLLGEVVFGGVGSGLYGMVLFVLMTVFLAGLMVGRTPEYFGKKIEAREMAQVIFALLAPSAMILVGSGIAAVTANGLSQLLNHGPHGFSEILYAFTSAGANNGSAFAGLNANTFFYNLFLALAMLVGRFAVIVPVLAVAGSLSTKTSAPPSPGTFAVDTTLFAVLLTGVILIVGGLTFLPALALGPIVEHFLMIRGLTF